MMDCILLPVGIVLAVAEEELFDRFKWLSSLAAMIVKDAPLDGMSGPDNTRTEF